MSRDGAGGQGRSQRWMIVPFVLGTATGGLAGLVAGVLIGDQISRVVSGMVGMVDRRDQGRKRGEPRFDLLLQ